VSQAIFEQSLGFFLLLLTPQPIDVFLSNQYANSWRAKLVARPKDVANFERRNPYEVL